LNNAEVVQDFRRRYEGTFVWLKMEEKNKEVLVKVRQVEDSYSKIGVLHLDSEEFGAISLNMGSDGHSIQFKYPPVGVFQYKKDAYLFRRRPARQYQRGICGGNSIMMNVTRNLVGPITRWTMDEVRAAFDHKTFEKKEALSLLKNRKVRSVALYDNYALCLSLNDNPDHLLFHWNSPIAQVNEDGKVTSVLEESYKRFLTGDWNDC